MRKRAPPAGDGVASGEGDSLIVANRSSEALTSMSSDTKAFGRVVVGTLLLVVTGLGCDLITGTRSDTEMARAEVTTEGGEVIARIITSQYFQASRQSEGGANVTLIDSDTVVDSLPYDEQHDIRDSQRFFVTVEAADTSATGTSVTLKAYLDGNERFRSTVPLGEEPLTFIYRTRSF